MTYDCKTKTLFTSDLFGSYGNEKGLYLELMEACTACTPKTVCPINDRSCPIRGILSFHERIMNSAKALRYALEKVEKREVSLIAPQHGSLIRSPEQMNTIIKHLKNLEHVGFDYYLQETLK